jgi:hypothetical protein
LISVSLRLRKSQLTALDQPADAERTSWAAAVREATERPLKRL